MIDGAKTRLEETNPELAIDFREASVVELPYGEETFDVVTSHRCLMALLDWELQQLFESARYLPAAELPRLDAFAANLDEKFVDKYLEALEPLRPSKQPS